MVCYFERELKVLSRSIWSNTTFKQRHVQRLQHSLFAIFSLWGN